MNQVGDALKNYLSKWTPSTLALTTFEQGVASLGESATATGSSSMGTRTHEFPDRVKNRDGNNIFWGPEKVQAWSRMFADANVTQSAKNGISMNHQLHFWFDNARLESKTPPMRQVSRFNALWTKASSLGVDKARVSKSYLLKVQLLAGNCDIVFAFDKSRRER
ncbi:hypothetical protein VTH06DRAFT_2959 [Thermothelomyces fergusii]